MTVHLKRNAVRIAHCVETPAAVGSRYGMIASRDWKLYPFRLSAYLGLKLPCQTCDARPMTFGISGNKEQLLDATLDNSGQRIIATPSTCLSIHETVMNTGS